MIILSDVKLKASIHGKKRKVIEVDGKKFAEVESKTNRKGEIEIVFKEFDEVKFEDDLEKMAKLISPKVDSKEIVKQALREIPLDEFKKIQEEFDKPKPFIQSRVGCSYLKIGKGNKSPILNLRE